LENPSNNKNKNKNSKKNRNRKKNRNKITHSMYFNSPNYLVAPPPKIIPQHLKNQQSKQKYNNQFPIPVIGSV
jgi:hypothetical protein